MGLKICLTYSLVSLLFALSYTPTSGQQNGDLDAKIREVFSTNPQQQPERQPVQRQDVGFDTIVTPVPLDPNQPQPDFMSISGKAQCNCVPYHQCDPSTNAVTEEEEFDGFGLIDLRAQLDGPVCQHFLDICCDNNRTRSESLKPRPQASRTERAMGCGIRNVGGIDFNITGATDNEAGFGEFPWTVALLHASNFSYFCAGSLIHPRVVLTAVHCVRDMPTNSFIVRAGEWDSQTTRERLAYEERSVQTVLSHPQFNYRNVANDFALIIVDSPFTLGDHINVVCLPGQNDVAATGTTCFSTGWGKDVFGLGGRYSTILKRVPLPIVDFNVCQSQLRGTRLGPRFKLDRTFMCAGGVRGVDTCEGDGGAPLVCPVGVPTENRYVQSGIVAWGIGCNDNIPAAYANVALARDWIDEQMLANGFGTSSYVA